VLLYPCGWGPARFTLSGSPSRRGRPHRRSTPDAHPLQKRSKQCVNRHRSTRAGREQPYSAMAGDGGLTLRERRATKRGCNQQRARFPSRSWRTVRRRRFRCHWPISRLMDGMTGVQPAGSHKYLCKSSKSSRSICCSLPDELFQAPGWRWAVACGPYGPERCTCTQCHNTALRDAACDAESAVRQSTRLERVGLQTCMRSWYIMRPSLSASS
jgi:hypothetical protein